MEQVRALAAANLEHAATWTNGKTIEELTFGARDDRVLHLPKIVRDVGVREKVLLPAQETLCVATHVS